MNVARKTVLLCALACSVIASSLTIGQSAKARIPVADVLPIVDALRADLLPAELRGKAQNDLERSWPDWIAQRDAAIRARVAGGDDDSVINFLLYGTTFTTKPRATDRELADLVGRPAAALSALGGRIDDFIAALATPGANERLQFARQVIQRQGVDPSTDAGKAATRRYLEMRLTAQEFAAAARSQTLLGSSTDVDLSDKLTLFKERGLSTDTSIFTDLGIEQALEDLKSVGAFPPGSVRRVAIIGPGLDFTDKLEGYDFYPEQTIQPFAVLDSLSRLDLAAADGVQITAFDLSPRVLQHLASARDRARAGTPYTVVLPRNTERPWSPELADYWQSFGNWIGEPGKGATSPPPGAGRVDVRSVVIRPQVVLSVTPVDLNIVTERFDLPGEPFDLMIATNILLYYDVFEQSLAMANVARMLKPNGFLLSNNRVFELPGGPMAGVGYTDSTYMSIPGVGDTGDRVIWFQKQ